MKQSVLNYSRNVFKNDEPKGDLVWASSLRRNDLKTVLKEIEKIRLSDPSDDATEEEEQQQEEDTSQQEEDARMARLLELIQKRQKGSTMDIPVDDDVVATFELSVPASAANKNAVVDAWFPTKLSCPLPPAFEELLGADPPVPPPP